jgi:hypothetical protein
MLARVHTYVEEACAVVNTGGEEAFVGLCRKLPKTGKLKLASD